MTSPLIDFVLLQIVEDVKVGDLTAIEILIRDIPEPEMTAFLSAIPSDT
jgi:hypothetical protein